MTGAAWAAALRPRTLAARSRHALRGKQEWTIKRGNSRPRSRTEANSQDHGRNHWGGRPSRRHNNTQRAGKWNPNLTVSLRVTPLSSAPGKSLTLPRGIPPILLPWRVPLPHLFQSPCPPHPARMKSLPEPPRSRRSNFQGHSTPGRNRVCCPGRRPTPPFPSTERFPPLPLPDADCGARDSLLRRLRGGSGADGLQGAEP